MPRNIKNDVLLNPTLKDVPDNKEDCQLIWLDKRMGECSDSRLTQEMFRIVNRSVQFFTDIDRCVELVRNIVKEHIIIVVSGSLAHSLMSQICDLRAVRVIFIYCEIKDTHMKLINRYPSKFVDIFTDRNLLLQAIVKTMKLMEKQNLPFDIYNQKENSNGELSVDSASFLWHQLLVEILRKLPSNEQAKNEMLDQCAAYYRYNKSQMKKIDSFRSSYSPDQAMSYYTQGSFVYNLLNKALRTEDIELLYTFRFFIIALCDQLENENEHEEQLNDLETIAVYRGLCVSREEFEKLNKAIGSLISMKGFLTTSRSMEAALVFAPQCDENSEMMGVLLEIRAAAPFKGIVFADTSDTENEHSVLFSLGAIFCIDTCIFDKDLRIWKIQLTTCDDGTELKQNYLKAQENQLSSHSPLIYFGHLLMNEMQQVQSAEKYFHKLLTVLPADHADIPDIFFYIGLIHKHKAVERKRRKHLTHYKKEMQQALLLFEKALTIWRETLPEGDLRIINSLTNIGSIYADLENFKTAFDYYQEAFSLVDNVGSDESTFKASLLEECSMLKSKLGDHSAAISLDVRAYEIYSKILPEHHTLKVDILIKIAGKYEDIHNFLEALSYYTQAFNYCDVMLSPTDAKYYSTWMSTVRCCLKINDEKSLSTYLDRVLAKCKSLSSTTSTISNNYILKIIELFEHSSNFDMAFECYKNMTVGSDDTIVIYFSSLSEAHPTEKYGLSREQHLKLLSFHMDVYRKSFCHVNAIERAKFLYKMAEKYLEYELFDNATAILQDAFNMLEVTDTENYELFSQCCIRLINGYMNADREDAARECMTLALQKCANDNQICTELLWRMGQSYVTSNNAKRADEFYKESFTRFTDMMVEKSFDQSSLYIFKNLSTSIIWNYLKNDNNREVAKFILTALKFVPSAETLADNIYQLMEHYESINVHKGIFDTLDYLLMNDKSDDFTHQQKLDQLWVISVEHTCRIVTMKKMDILKKIMDICIYYLSPPHHKMADLFIRMAEASESEGDFECAITFHDKGKLIWENIVQKRGHRRALAALKFYCARYNNDSHIERILPKLDEEHLWCLMLKRCTLLKMGLFDNYPEYEQQLCRLVQSIAFAGVGPQMIGSIQKTLKVEEDTNDFNSYVALRSFEFLEKFYDQDGQYQKSLFYRQCQLNTESKLLHISHSDCGWSMRSIGLSFQRIGEYDISLKYLSQALVILTQSCCVKESDIEQIKEDITLTKQLFAKMVPSHFVKDESRFLDKTNIITSVHCSDAMLPQILQTSLKID